MQYNAAFFGTHESYFLVLKEKYGEEAALEIFREVMERKLKKAYDEMKFTKGDPEDFARVVGERDRSVGLEVEFPEVRENRIVYQFHTDPFPNLKGKIDWKRLVDTYMAFKVRYLLGDDWSYTTTKHVWEADCTEHIISKN